MPARNSILLSEKERNYFAPVSLSFKLLNKIREIVVFKMPKKYSYYDCKVLFNYAFKVCANAREANSIFISKTSYSVKDVNKRIKLWKKARRKLQVVRTEIDVLLNLMDTTTLSRKDMETGHTNSVSNHDIEEVLDLIIKTQEELTKTINREKQQLKQNTNK